MKRVFSLFLAVILCLSLSAAAFAAGDGPSKDDLDDILASVTYPSKGAYLPEYRYATVLPTGDNRSIYAFSSPSATKRIAVLDEGEELTVLAKQGKRVCAIVESTQKAYWLNVDLLCFTFTLSEAPCKADLEEVYSFVAAPRNRDFLPEYRYGVAEPTGNNHAIKAYLSSTAEEHSSTIEGGEGLILLAKQNSRYCVIVESSSKAYWVNAAVVTLGNTDDCPHLSDGARETDSRSGVSTSAPASASAPATSHSAPCKADLDEAITSVEYPKSYSYFSEYKYGHANPSGNNHAIYGFISPTGKDHVTTIEEGEAFTILAKQNGRLCVIVNSSGCAYWVTAERVAIDK